MGDATQVIVACAGFGVVPQERKEPSGRLLSTALYERPTPTANKLFRCNTTDPSFAHLDMANAKLFRSNQLRQQQQQQQQLQRQAGSDSKYRKTVAAKHRLYSTGYRKHSADVATG